MQIRRTGGISSCSMFRLKGTDDSFFKTNLAIYDNDMLVVTGTSYYLWILDNYKDISAEVQRVWEEENKVTGEEEEDCPEERSNQETLDSGRCCELQYSKVRLRAAQLSSDGLIWQLSDTVQDIDKKIATVGDRLNVIVDSQNKLGELHKKYRLD